VGPAQKEISRTRRRVVFDLARDEQQPEEVGHAEGEKAGQQEQGRLVGDGGRAEERTESRHDPDQRHQQGEDNVPCDQKRNSSLSMAISSPSCQAPSGPRLYSGL